MFLTKFLRGREFYPVQLVMRDFPSTAHKLSERSSDKPDTSCISRAEIKEILDIELGSVGDLVACWKRPTMLQGHRYAM